MTFPHPPTSLQILLQAPAASVELLLRQGERPFTRKLWEVEVGKLPLQVLVQDGKFPIALGAELPARHVHVVDLQPGDMHGRARVYQQEASGLHQKRRDSPRRTHHKPLRVLLHVFVRRDGDGHRLLVAVVVVGLDVLASFQPIGLLSRDGQHGQNQLLLPRTDQVNHLLVGGAFHAHAVAGGRGHARY